MANYQYHRPGASLSGCAGTAMAGGWYAEGGDTPIVPDYRNPETGMAYTPTELNKLVGGGTSGGAPTGAPTGGGGAPTETPTGANIHGVWFEGEYLGDVDESFSGLDQSGQETYIQENFGVDVSGQMWAYGGHPSTTLSNTGYPSPQQQNIPQVPIPSYDPNAVSAPDITPAPEYEKSPEQLAWEEKQGGIITNVLEKGGLGIPEETQQLMKQQLYSDLRARETESIRLLRNNMEQRGITNSGLLISEEQKIISTTTRGVAAGITEIKIKSAFMKMASFENALGLSAQFLGYLSEQSQLANAPKTATWMAQQTRKLAEFQANIEIYKTKLQQAYTVDNMYTAQKIQMELNEQMHGFNVALAEMEMEWGQEAAKAEAQGSISGTIVTGIATVAGAIIAA